MTSLMPASAMFDLRKKYFGIRGKPDSAEIEKIKLAFLFFSDFRIFQMGGSEKQLFKKILPNLIKVKSHMTKGFQICITISIDMLLDISTL